MPPIRELPAAIVLALLIGLACVFGSAGLAHVVCNGAGL